MAAYPSIIISEDAGGLAFPLLSAALRMALYRSGGQTGRDTWSSCHSWISAQSTGGQVNRRKAVQSGMRVPARPGRFFRLTRHSQIPSDFDANKTDFPRVHIRDLLASFRTAGDRQRLPKLTVPAGSANDRWRRSTAPKADGSLVWAKMYPTPAVRNTHRDRLSSPKIRARSATFHGSTSSMPQAVFG
jgi:hypothetical protein